MKTRCAYVGVALLASLCPALSLAQNAVGGGPRQQNPAYDNIAQKTAAPASMTQVRDALATTRQLATNQIKAGQAQQACELLTPLLANHDADLELHFLVGQCLSLTGHVDEAIAQYKLVLSRQPNALRVLAELATLEAKVGNKDAARRDLQVVLAANPPAAVRPGLEDQLASLGGPITSSEWTARVSLAEMFDSNVNAGPSISSVTLFGLPFLVQGAAQKRSDAAELADVSVDYFHLFNADIGIGAGASAHGILYDQVSSFNYDSFSGYVGPTVRIGDDGKVTAVALVDYSQLAGRAFSSDWGTHIQYQKPLSSNLVFNEEFLGRENEFYKNGDYSGWAGYSTTSIQWLYQPGAFVQPKITVGREYAHYMVHTDNQVGFAIGVYQPIGWGFAAYVEPGVRRSWYQDLDPEFGVKRRDTYYSITANLGYDLGYHSSQLVLSYFYTNNNSNQDLYQYNRNQVMLRLAAPLLEIPDMVSGIFSN